jgi:hypothetical protein
MCVNGRLGEASSSKLTRNRSRGSGALAKSKGLALNRRLSGEADRRRSHARIGLARHPEWNWRDEL